MEKQPDKNNLFNKLPEYQAPDHLWERIRKDLDEPEKLVPLQDRLQELPQYQAPASVWKEIHRKLGGSQTVKLYPIIRKWGAAASILVLLGFWGWQFLVKEAGPQVQYAQWEEVIEQDWQLETNDDETAFAMVTTFCKQKEYVCKTPEFQNLRAELDELNLACESLREAIGQYNDEPAMIAQLTEIEMERTQVLKKIMTYL